MESSAALFAQGSPFAVRSPPRSHYHPSPARPRHQRTVLSPALLLPEVPAATIQHPPAPAVPSSLDLRFLEGPSCQETALDSDSTIPFPESWPSTEHSSSNTLQGTPTSGQPPSPSVSVQDGESVIAKYIERFRLGQPSSRSQRQAPTLSSTREFWWLEPVPPSDSSTPKGGDSQGGAQLEEASPRWALGSPLLCPVGSPTDTSLPDPPDTDTQSLQERAARLLLRSESSVNSTVPVSSEGLHSNPKSSTLDSDQALPGPPQPSLLDPSPGPLPSTHWLPAHIPQCISSTVPEEDILFQWRLRRKMEQASQAVGSLPVTDWSTQLAWCPRMSDRACTVHPGLGLVPGMTSWRSGDGSPFISHAAQPEVRSSSEWTLTPTTLHQGMGHPQGHQPRAQQPLEVPLQKTEPVVGPNPKAIHVLGQLTPATASSSTHRPERGGGGDAAEMWSSREAHRGAGPAERPGSREAHRGAGPAERPGSREAHRGAGPAERPGSREAHRGAGLAERPGSREAHRGAGPAERPGSREAHRGAGPAERPGSREAHRGAGPAERPGSREAHRGAGLAERPGSREAHPEAWALGASQHLPKETTRSQSMQGRGDRGAPEPEATHRQRRKGRKWELSIHNTLGQVISERLFSPPASPPPCREQQSGQRVEWDSPPEQGAEPEQLDPSTQHPQLLRLASRLLEDAEESDGTEFEEDPLLQVLRDQREVLRSQLRAVNIAAAQLLAQGAAEPMSEPLVHSC